MTPRLTAPLIVALTALAVVAPTASVAAAGPDAAPLSLQGQARAGAEAGEPNQLDSSLAIIGLVSVAVIIALILLLDDDDDPESP